MSPLDQLRALGDERKAINDRLQPLSMLMAQKQSELSKVRAAVADAQATLDAAVKHSATIAAQQALGSATIDDAKSAMVAREAAQKEFADAQALAVGIRDLITEYDAMQAAGHDLALRLGAIGNEESALRERYLRQLADDAAADYATVAQELSEKLATVLAYQQALAAANLNPDLLTPAVWGFSIPSLNSPSAQGKSGSGLLIEVDHARQMQPIAFQQIRQRIAVDGVSISGL